MNRTKNFFRCIEWYILNAFKIMFIRVRATKRWNTMDTYFVRFLLLTLCENEGTNKQQTATIQL